MIDYGLIKFYLLVVCERELRYLCLCFQYFSYSFFHCGEQTTINYVHETQPIISLTVVYYGFVLPCFSFRFFYDRFVVIPFILFLIFNKWYFYNLLFLLFLSSNIARPFVVCVRDIIFTQSFTHFYIIRARYTEVAR